MIPDKKRRDMTAISLLGGAVILAAAGAAYFIGLGWLRGPTTPPTVSRVNRTLSRPETASPQCNLWTEISLQDVGDHKCVYGVVESAYSSQETFYVRFTTGQGVYFLSREFVFPEVAKGACVMALGEIERVADSPVIVLDEQTSLYYCQ